MTDTSTTALGLSRLLLRVLIVLNAVGGVLMTCAFVASFLFSQVLVDYCAQNGFDAAILIPAVRLWLVLALPVVAAVHIVFRRLLEILATVREGDPFVIENATRLRTVAWCLLVVQIFHLLFFIMVRIAALADADIDWELSLNGWLAVLLAFVLSKVFEHGARMRDDLGAMI